jgi:RecA-family ATPase
LETVEALAMATGRNLLGVPVPHKLFVWYINLEDPMDEIVRRFSAAMLHFKIKAEDIAGQLFINSGRETDILVAEGTPKGRDCLISDPTAEAVIAQIIEH